jgi:2'-5' RNA ligase
MTPDESSALIVRVQLPPGLERLRQAYLPGALRGLPAHCTLLYPFTAPESLSPPEVAALRTRIHGHPAHHVRLSRADTWPEVLYAAVDQDSKLRTLQADLAGMFPTLPLYGGGVPFVPHVTIVAGPEAGLPELMSHHAWRALPRAVPVLAVDLIASDGDRWRRHRRFGLGSPPTSRIRPARCRRDAS